MTPDGRDAGKLRSGATRADLADLYRLLAIAKYDERHVIPPAHAEDAGRLMALLQYPMVALFDGAGQLAGAGSGAPRASRAPFGIFLDWLSRTCPDAAALHYVEIFDLKIGVPH